MNFLLYSSVFDCILLLLFFVNLIITWLLTIKERKRKKRKKDKEESKINEKAEIIDKERILSFINATTHIYVFIFIILVIYLAFKFNFISIFPLIFYFSILWNVMKNRSKNVNSLTYENKADYINTILLYLLFFSFNTTSLYVTSFSNVSHVSKEYLLILFISIKLIFFAYCVITNIFIFLSNLTIILNNKLIKIKKNVKEIINSPFKSKFYNFHFSIKTKNTNFLIVDFLIFFVTFPFCLLYNFVILIFIVFFKWLYKKCASISNKVNNYLENSSMIIPKIIKISTIFSLIVVYLIIIYNESVISDQTKEFYNFIITVILIPLIYDGIKSKNNS